MTDICPLCQSRELSSLNSISTAVLGDLYLKGLGIDIAFEAKSLHYFLCNACGLGFFSPIETGSERFYEHLQQFDWYYMSDKWEYDFAKKYVTSESNVLEVGSGMAAFAQLICPRQYTGLEFNDKAIARAHGVGIHLIKQSVENHAKICKPYDIVVSFQVLEHVSDPAGFVGGCVACLKRGGLLVVAVPAHDGFVGAAINCILDMPPHHVTHWSNIVLEKLAPLFGLELITLEYEPVAEYHKLWARKIIFESKIRHLLGMKDWQLDTRLFARAISKAASLLSKFIPISVDGLKGHTVAAVYRKIG
jgi:SAM-dependent methyltransferase